MFSSFGTVFCIALYSAWVLTHTRAENEVNAAFTPH